MLLVTALCSLGVYPLSQVAAGSAAESKHLVLPGCAEIILTMSPQQVQPEMHLMIALCSLGVCPLSQVEAGSAAKGKHLVLPGCAENHPDNQS